MRTFFSFSLIVNTICVNLCAYEHRSRRSSIHTYRSILIVFCSLARGAYTPLIQFRTCSSDSHCTRSSESTQGPRSYITLPLPSLITVQAARKQPPCCSALQCLLTVPMSWARLKWARSEKSCLTASA